MPILAALGLLVLLVVVFGPSWWVRHILKRHSAERVDFPGTGSELARHLLDEAGLQTVSVDVTDLGDHYDPDAQAVRLLPQHHNGRSIAAIAVAAHEVSHAVQHARGEPSFTRRHELVKNVVWFDKIASVFLLLSPLVLTRGGYLSASDMLAARDVLRAAAWTYVAAALATLLNLGRWLRILRF